MFYTKFNTDNKEQQMLRPQINTNYCFTFHNEWLTARLFYVRSIKKCQRI